MFGDDETLNNRWRQCETKVGLAVAVVERILRAARHAEYYADYHVEIIRNAVRGMVERDLLPELVDVIVDPRHDLIAEEGPGRWLYAKDKISTDPSETLFRPILDFIACIYEETDRGGDRKIAHGRAVACLIHLRTAQKRIDYRAIVRNRR